MITTVISFRVHKNLKSWLEFAGRFSPPGEIVRLAIQKAAFEQAAQSKFSKLVERTLPSVREQPIGNTLVLAVRLPVSVAELVKQCSAERGITPSEWCHSALSAWYSDFNQLYQQNSHRHDYNWLVSYSEKYRRETTALADVYAQKIALMRKNEDAVRK